MRDYTFRLQTARDFALAYGAGREAFEDAWYLVQWVQATQELHEISREDETA